MKSLIEFVKSDVSKEELDWINPRRTSMFPNISYEITEVELREFSWSNISLIRDKVSLELILQSCPIQFTEQLQTALPKESTSQNPLFWQGFGVHEITNI